MTVIILICFELPYSFFKGQSTVLVCAQLAEVGFMCVISESWKGIFWLLHDFIIKFRYNARSDWLKQRALSEYRCTE